MNATRSSCPVSHMHAVTYVTYIACPHRALVTGKRSHNIIRIHTHTYSVLAKASVDIDCEPEILYSKTANVYVYNTIISSGTVWTTNPKTSVVSVLAAGRKNTTSASSDDNHHT